MWNWKALKSSLCPQVTTSDLSSLKIYLYWIVQMKRNILIAIQMLWKCVVEKTKLCLPDTIIMHPFISYKLSDSTEPNHPTQCFFIFSLFFFFFKKYFSWLIWIKTAFVEQYHSLWNLCFSLRNSAQQTLFVKDQKVNILDFVGHIWSLLYILLYIFCNL